MYGEALHLWLRAPRPGLRGPRDALVVVLSASGAGRRSKFSARAIRSFSRAVPRTRARRVLSLNVRFEFDSCNRLANESNFAY